MEQQYWRTFISILPKIQQVTEEGWIFEFEEDRIYAKERYFPEKGSWHFDDFNEFTIWLDYIVKEK